MESFRWLPVGAVDLDRLCRARIQVHRAVQWLARAAYAYVPPQPDDRHASLAWDDTFGGFVTLPLRDAAGLALRLADLTLAFRDGRTAAPVLALDGLDDRQVRVWLGEQVTARGCDAARLDAPLPYRGPEGDGVYATAGLADFFGALAVWCANADAALAAMRRDIINRNLDATEVRCWPHHIDFDTVVTVAPGRTTGIGLSLGDHYYEEPYFYVNMRPKRDIAGLPKLPALGHWHEQQFTGAIATASRIARAKDQGREVEAFLREAATAAIGAVGG